MTTAARVSTLALIGRGWISVAAGKHHAQPECGQQGSQPGEIELAGIGGQRHQVAERENRVKPAAGRQPSSAA